MDVLIKPASTAQTMPILSLTQNEGGSSPRTARYSGCSTSSGDVTAVSLRMAWQSSAVVAVNVRPVWLATPFRTLPLSLPSWRRNSFIGW